jgi:hypothetical protein
MLYRKIAVISGALFLIFRYSKCIAIKLPPFESYWSYPLALAWFADNLLGGVGQPSTLLQEGGLSNREEGFLPEIPQKKSKPEFKKRTTRLV